MPQDVTNIHQQLRDFCQGQEFGCHFFLPLILGENGPFEESLKAKYFALGILVIDMSCESKLHIYTQEIKVNGFSQFLACKE